MADEQDTLEAYGQTWPLIRTSQAVATAVVTVRLPSAISAAAVDDALKRLNEDVERRLAGYSDVTVAVEQVDELRLSPADQAEHDRLQQEAMKGTTP